MPWNDNANPGPWGSPPPEGDKDKPGAPGPAPDREEPRRPQPPPRRPQPPPAEGVDLNELIERWSGRLRGLFGGNGGGGSPGQSEDMVRRYAPIVGGLLVAVYFFAGVIVVGAKEEAVVTTFGAWSRSYGPGVGFHFPLVEGYRKVDITTINETIVGGVKAGTVEDESLMLTGDENIVDLPFAVNWKVSNAGKSLFNVTDIAATVKAVAESSMREVVGRSQLDPILTTDRGRIQAEAATLMQRILDSYDSGVVIDSVQIRAAEPPKPVVAAFQDVAAAGQNYQAKVNEAEGKASQIKQAALGYKAQVVNEAVGEAQRFNQLYVQYRLAPGVTRQRLYIETMERVLSHSNKVIIDGKGVTAPIVLSPDVFKPRVPAAAPAARAPGAAQ
ncbi:MAG: hflK [Caulobacter sp.]|nr:hflK [Caulobacter sp.]